MEKKAKKTFYHEAGKGSKPVPRQITKEEYDLNWERTFGKAEKEEVK